MDLIKIKCPCCGATLMVRGQLDLEKKKVVCPVCKESNFFTAYRRVYPVQYKQSECVEDEEPTCYQTEDEKSLNVENDFIGVLRLEHLQNGEYFHLKIGENIVGRKANRSSANVQIPIEDRRTSREHLTIDVKTVPGKGYVHCLSLYKESCNETLVNGEKIEFGDIIVLQSGDKIQLPGITLVFEILDEEATIC